MRCCRSREMGNPGQGCSSQVGMQETADKETAEVLIVRFPRQKAVRDENRPSKRSIVWSKD